MKSTFCSSLLALGLIVSTAAAQNDAPGPTDNCSPARATGTLSPGAEQIATNLGVLPQLQRLRALASVCPQTTAASFEQLEMRQQITETVMLASLDVDAVLAEIDDERAHISELRDSLSSRRDRRINLLTIANIVAGTGSGIIGTAMQFNDRTAIAGDAVGVGGGVAGVLLSILGLRQQGGAAPLGVAPNMLAPLFGRRAELRSTYPGDVWRYLNSIPASDPRVHLPWREQLISQWTKSGRIPSGGGPVAEKKIDLLSSRIGEQRRLSLGILNDRSAMLLDLRASVSLMKGNLRDLMAGIATRLPD